MKQFCVIIFWFFFPPPQLAHSQEQKEEDDKGELVEQLQTLQTHKSFIAEVSNHRHHLCPVFFRFLLGSDVLDEGDEVDEHQPFPSLSQVNSSAVCPDFLVFFNHLFPLRLHKKHLIRLLPLCRFSRPFLNTWVSTSS